MKEETDKEGGWFNWSFQTFSTIKVIVERSATKFPLAFSYE